MIQFREKYIASLVYVVGILSLIIPPLNVILTHGISKKYKNKSSFVYEHAIDAANINLTIIIHSIVLMLLFAVFGLLFRTSGISIDSITTNIAIIYVILYYFLQILIAIIKALRGKPSKLIIWPVFFEK